MKLIGFIYGAKVDCDRFNRIDTIIEGDAIIVEGSPPYKIGKFSIPIPNYFYDEIKKNISDKNQITITIEAN